MTTRTRSREGFVRRARPADPPPMTTRTRSREGFVLLSVLLILMLFTALALAAASMATQQVRMAGGMHTSVVSLHAAEGGASWVVNAFGEGALAWAPEDGEVTGEDLAQLGDGIAFERPDEPNHGVGAWWVEAMDFEGDRVTVRVNGQVMRLGVRTRTIEVVYTRGEAGSSSPFAGAVVGCDGVQISGSGSIDSWDSSQGPYSPFLAGSNATVGTLSEVGDVVLSGSSPIYGNVASRRDIRLSGSAAVLGDFQAMRDIVFQGNPTCPAATVEAGGVISAPGWWRPNCPGQEDWEEGANVQIPAQACDPLNVQQMMADSAAAWAPDDGVYANWSHTGWRPDPVAIDSDTALASFSIGPGAYPVTIDAGEADVLFVNGNFSLTSSAQLHIQNPSFAGTTPQELKIFVNGDLSASGNSQLRIDPGVSVQFFVTGTVNFTGGHGQTIPPTVDLNPGGPPRIAPSLSITSSWVGNAQGNNAGVRIGGSSPLSASVYAPLASVQVTGSSALYGAVRGRTVQVSGSASIHYDEALGMMGGGAGGEGTAARVVRWREVP